jgi:Zn-dependent M28 family amino/carboxypeptidase
MQLRTHFPGRRFLSAVVATTTSLLAIAPLAAQSAAGSRQVVPPLAARWWNVVSVLADDSLHGRATGTEDYLKAARYVAQEFQKAGLAPAGTDGYFQIAHLATARLVAERSGIALLHDGVADTLKLGTDASITLSTTTAAHAEGPMVFVGYGLHFPGVRDDLGGTSVRGKVAVYLNRLPSGLNATIMAHSRSGRWEALRAAGAIAAIAINEPPAAGGRGGRGGAGASPVAGGPRPANGLADDPSGGGVMITVPDSGAARLFAGSGHTYTELVALANKDSAAVLPTFPLVPTLTAWTELATTPLEAPNVLGMLRGSDPALRDQYVIVSAHLDHLGIGRPVDGDSIYNGAMDNASGIATMLETARAFHDRHIAPKRSLIFAAVTAEEKGELGSAYLVTHPTVPVGQTVADLNTDMWEPQIPLVGVFGYGADESDLGIDLRQALKLHNLTLMEDPHPEQVRFIRSDQYSFIKRGIPALALKIGYLPGSPGDSVIAEWNRVRYHKPSDDVDQPVDFDAAIGFDAMYIDLVHLVADRPTRPAWVKGSVFATGVHP